MDEIYCKGVPLKDIVEKYKQLNSVWKVGEVYGFTGQYIHSVLTRHGVIHKMNYFTKADGEKLRELYPQYRREQRLKELALIFNRTVPFLNRQAKRLGLTNKDRSDLVWSDDRRKAIGNTMRKRIAECGHPKGMLGKKHSAETLEALSRIHKKRAEDGLLFAQTDEGKEFYRQKAREYQRTGKLNSGHSRYVKGCVEIGGKQICVKSSWEYNVALLCEYLRSENRIKSWDYETETFDLTNSVVGFYKPDFKITLNNGEFFFIEVKGWFSDKSKVKMQDFRIQYPKVKLFIIDSNRYALLNKKYSHLNNWNNLIKKEYRMCSLEGCEKKHYSKGLCRHHYYKKYGS